jgi:tRNA 2-thiouridine synthesizing protein A
MYQLTNDKEFPMADFDQELDASGLNCPLPILRAKKALNGMGSGEVLHIIATDPGAVKDFEAFAKQTGNELVESREDGGKFYFLMKKG